MIRNAIGSLIALVGAAAAVWSVFLPWYGGRDGRDFALGDLFTPGGLNNASPALLAGLFLPMAVAALLTVVGVLLRARPLVALAGLLVLAFGVLWMVRQGIAQGSLTVGSDGGLDWGPAIALAGAVLLLFGALFMAGRRRKGGRGRHRGDPDARLRRRPAHSGAGLAATAPDDTPARDRAGAVAPRGEPAGTSGATAPGRPAAGRTGTAAGAVAAGAAAGAAGMAAARGGDRDSEPGRRKPSGAAAGGAATGEPGTSSPDTEATTPGGPGRAGALDARGTSGATPTGGGMAAAQAEDAGVSDDRSEAGGEYDTARQDGRTMAGDAAWSDAARRPEGAEETSQERTRPMPHTQPVTGSRSEPSTGQAGPAAGGPVGETAGGTAGGTGGEAAREEPAPGARAPGEGAGMGTSPRDERADWTGAPGTAGTRSPEPRAGRGPTPAEPASRPLAGAGAGGPSRSGGDLRAEKGPDAMRPEEARKGTAPEAESKEHGKEPFGQRLLHRLQNAGHRGQHGPRGGGHGGGDHRDAA